MHWNKIKKYSKYYAFTIQQYDTWPCVQKIIIKWRKYIYSNIWTRLAVLEWYKPGREPGCNAQWLRCIVGNELLLCLKWSCLILQREQDTWTAVMTRTKLQLQAFSQLPLAFYSSRMHLKKRWFMSSSSWMRSMRLKSSKEKHLFVYISSLAVSVPMGKFMTYSFPIWSSSFRGQN